MNFFDTVSFLATLSVYILCSHRSQARSRSVGVPGRLAPRPVGPSVVELPDLSLCGVTFARVLVLGSRGTLLAYLECSRVDPVRVDRAKIVAASIDIAYSDIAYSAFGVQKPNVAASIDTLLASVCSVLSSPIRRRSGARRSYKSRSRRVDRYRSVYSPRLFGVQSPRRSISPIQAEKNDRRRIPRLCVQERSWRRSATARRSALAHQDTCACKV